MVLYVDETENDQYFIVAGLLVESEDIVRRAYGRFKKRISGFKLGQKTKADLFVEFKAFLLDRKYQRIKIRMLEKIVGTNGLVVFSCYVKRNHKFNQVLKESIYITLFSSIIADLEQETVIVFDKFGKPDFEAKIKQTAMLNKSVVEVLSMNLQDKPGLQFVDNICSSIRLYKSKEDKWGFYDVLQDIIKEV